MRRQRLPLKGAEIIMNSSAISIVLYSLLLCCFSENSTADTVWDVNNTNCIAGHKTTVLGSPVVIETKKGKAVLFDGIDDAVIVDALAVAGANEFTLEVIIRPDPDGQDPEQKFLHVQENDSKNRIILLVAKGKKGHWYFDTFVKTAAGTQNMWDASKTHLTGRWYNVAIVCNGKRMGQYVNGILELSGKLELTAFGDGKTSIGAKIDRKSCFKGAIRKIRFTPRALKPREFLRP